MPQTVVIDTNMMLAHAQFKADVVSQLKRKGYQTVVMRSVANEVDKLAQGKTKDAAAARVAQELIAGRHVVVLEDSDPSADAAILRVAKERQWAVATNDKALIKKLKAMKATVFRLRQKRLALED